VAVGQAVVRTTSRTEKNATRREPVANQQTKTRTEMGLHIAIYRLERRSHHSMDFDALWFFESCLLISTQS